MWDGSHCRTILKEHRKISERKKLGPSGSTSVFSHQFANGFCPLASLLLPPAPGLSLINHTLMLVIHLLPFLYLCKHHGYTDTAPIGLEQALRPKD